MRRKTHEEFVQELAEVNPDIEVLGVYKNNRTKLLVKCKIDQYEWETTPSNLLRLRGCPMCAGNIKLTHEEFVQRLAIINPNIKILGRYKNMRSKILVKCKIDGYEWEARADHLLEKHGCPKCADILQKTHEEFEREFRTKFPDKDYIIFLTEYINAKEKILCYSFMDNDYWWARPHNLNKGQENPYTRYERAGTAQAKSHEQFIQEAEKKNPNVEIRSKYKNQYEKVLCYCKIHDCEYWQSPASILKGCGCIQCRSEKIHIAQSKTHEDYKAECLLLGLEPIEKYYNNQTPIMHRCLECGTEFLAMPGHVLRGHTGCYRCRQSASSYERRVMDILDKYNYGNKFQWSQKVYDNNRRYDFYLPEYNVAIEVDGEQHYKPVCFNGISQEKAEINYIEQQRIDAEKTRWCIENNIKLIRIPYYWSAEETEEYILNYLKEADYYGKEES